MVGASRKAHTTSRPPKTHGSGNSTTLASLWEAWDDNRLSRDALIVLNINMSNNNISYGLLLSYSQILMKTPLNILEDCL